MNETVRVLGIGSPFGADRIGWTAIAYLEQAGLPQRFPSARFECLDRPGLSLLAHCSGADRVVLIDALAGEEPGRIRRLAPGMLNEGRSASTHGFGVAEALALAKALGELPERLWVFGIGIGNAEEAVDFDPAPLVAAVTEICLGPPDS